MKVALIPNNKATPEPNIGATARDPALMALSKP
jgi:hypothetical protein